jgi:hypothetical protein
MAMKIRWRHLLWAGMGWIGYENIGGMGRLGFMTDRIAGIRLDSVDTIFRVFMVP